MHAHACYTALPMRTTVEIKDEYRAKLLELAARRGEKGFSSIIEEALRDYLDRDTRQEEVRGRALRLRGALSAKESDRLRSETGALRKSWR